MHISELESEPTAQNCLQMNLDDDVYHQNIQAAAQYLCTQYSETDWVYLTQWSSGTTLWADKTNQSHTITIEGKAEYDFLTLFLKNYPWEQGSLDLREKVRDLLLETTDELG